MGTPDPQDVPNLRDLIQRHADRTGESRRALGGRSGIAHQTLGYWHEGSIQTFPDPDTIRKFAASTGYSEQTVLLAAARTIGLRVTHSGTLLSNSLPPGTDALAAEDVDAIRAIVRQLVDARQQLQEAGDPPAGQIYDLAHPPMPDLSRVAARHGESEGRRRRDKQDEDVEHP